MSSLNIQDFIKPSLTEGWNDTVVVYHHTSFEKAQQILQTGRLKADKEHFAYVTNVKTPNTGYGDYVVAINIPNRLLKVDDEFPDGRIDYKIYTGSPGGFTRPLDIIGIVS